ncbi:PTS transporter subunit EIIC [Amedibacillus sp. YH-ame6]
MPLMITGSIFLLLAEFPIEQVTLFFDSVELKAIFNQAYECSFNIMALIAVIGIAYTYTDNEKLAALPAGIIALSGFLLLQPGSIMRVGNFEKSASLCFFFFDFFTGSAISSTG